MDFQVTGTYIWYYYICHRQVWLLAHQLFPDQDNENIRIGRIISENTYNREKKEIDLGNAKIDLIKTKGDKVIVGEVKKSSKYIESAKRQLQFYLLQLKEMGIEAKGELLFPEEKDKLEIELKDVDEKEINKAITNIKKIVAETKAPSAKKIKLCYNCAYNEFCWS
ncbi:CRISPR-associated RecB family exonuclease Cas4 [Candidatus Syntrophocurvum alkaliphilum]|uniref:CRISPR-associated exonuclease Cas4 n=1 Tax=Candidatus Syntrophocurvum alkaliphilum TaxID=2293317 RepID=A0A6I6DC06_9FIRM|nr:CRISPR-associated protein Cas4 [Candidatus Syntrophocurvum alkaliphilum]QGT99799.1 CRISPR-associated RecB family exonuclease Cas4 [Candidatus Syntrophocurvum alkaliphilum]